MFQLRNPLQNELTETSDLGGAPVAEVTTDVTAEVQPNVLDTGDASTQVAEVTESTSDNAAFFDSLPEDWRQQSVSKLGVEDQAQQEKMLNVLNRYPSYDKFVNAFFDQHKTIKSGAHKQGLSENPTDDELSAYREEAGIPAKAEDYDLALSDGLVLSEEDSRIMQGIYPVAHANNIPNAVMVQLVESMLVAREHEADAKLKQHGIDQQTATRQVKDAWGSDFETNKNVIRGLFNGLPESARDSVMSATLPDGKMLFNSPEFLVWAADVGRQLNPSATVVPNSGNPAETIKSELKKIEDVMRNDADAYYKDSDMQKRYLDLLEAKGRMEA